LQPKKVHPTHFKKGEPMSTPDVEALLPHYPAIIDQMPETFTSHDFILALAQQYQREYIDVLYACRDEDNPFMVAHIRLAKGLNHFPEKVEKSERVNSKNIFGGWNEVRAWRKRG
jgi:hypothetical protein